MGCIRVDRIVEYLAEPLRRSVKDKDPYVRKTAAVAIAKLFDLNKQMAIDQGFVECLEELLTDDNPMVVANAVKSLSEIAENCEEVELTFNPTTVKSLLAALNDCTEYVIAVAGIFVTRVPFFCASVCENHFFNTCCHRFVSLCIIDGVKSLFLMLWLPMIQLMRRKPPISQKELPLDFNTPTLLLSCQLSR